MRTGSVPSGYGESHHRNLPIPPRLPSIPILVRANGATWYQRKALMRETAVVPTDLTPARRLSLKSTQEV